MIENRSAMSVHGFFANHAVVNVDQPVRDNSLAEQLERTLATCTTHLVGAFAVGQARDEITAFLTR